MATVRERNASDSTSSTGRNLAPPTPGNKKDNVVKKQALQHQITASADAEALNTAPAEKEVFGDEEGAEIQYKTCKWWHTGICTYPFPLSSVLLLL